MKENLIKKNTEKFFDEAAERGDIFSEAEKGQKFVADRIDEKGKKGINILDVGCGEGKTLEIISKKGSFGLYGIDISKKAIEKAKKRLVDNAENLICGDVDNMPFEDEEFDLLICSHSFHHYPNPRKSLSEMYRVTKTNGELWIIENDAHPFQRIRYNLYQILHRHPAGDVKKYSHKKLYRLTKDAGFKSIQISGATEKAFLVVAVK